MARQTEPAQPISSPPLPAGWMRLCLIVLLSEGPAHGYQLLEKLRSAGLGRAEAGSVYPCLHYIEQQGLVGSWWEPSPGGPPKRLYELSDAGLRAVEPAAEVLREVGASFGRMAKAVAAAPPGLLGGAGGVAEGGGEPGPAADP